MSQKCEICGKMPIVGNRISHAHNVTKRRWMPNLQRIRIMVDGTPRKMNVCVQCLRTGRVEKAVQQKSVKNAS
jgi:large subunit ribosomal protein L28